MRLNELLEGVARQGVAGNLSLAVSGLSYNSQSVRKNFLFFALPGSRTDGNRYVKEAVSRGAAVVVSELNPPPAPYPLPATWVQVPDAHEAMAKIASRFYGAPSQKMQVIGVTGTNGKTTTTYYLEAIFKAAGIPCGVLGTVNYRLGSKELMKAPNTTPLSLDLESLLSRLLKGGATHVAMEVSSHALALKRVEQIRFRVGVFTNIHRDHLDFHHTPEDYFSAKAHLFDLLRGNAAKPEGCHAVLNADDFHSSRLAEMIAEPVKISWYGLSPKSDWRAENIEEDLDQTCFDLVAAGARRRVRLQLAGRHNVYNALAASCAAGALAIPSESIYAGLEALSVVPGRLEAVRCGQNFYVFVDYAHTDSALEQALLELNRLKSVTRLNRIITVFGCGGDRDRSKRGPMGAAACRLSDLAILTSDNPRTEDPLKIIEDIEKGIQEQGFQNYRTLPDRKEAIHFAVRSAGERDGVLIAGKGHEDYQILKDKTIHFDDREIVREAIRARLQ